MWGTFKCTDKNVMVVTEGEEREKLAQRILEEAATENFPNLLKNIHLHIEKSQQIPDKINTDL